jgi:hypothetical protein
MPSADQLAGTFASFFLDAVVVNDLNTIQGMFAPDASFVLVDDAGQKTYSDPNERTGAVLQIVDSVAAANFNVESVSGADVTNGVAATVMLSVLTESYTQRWCLSALLEKIDEDVFCVRQLCITFFQLNVIAVLQQEAAAAAPVAPTPAPAPTVAPPVPESPEKLREAPEAQPAPTPETKPKRTMKKAQKAAVAPVVEEAAPVQQPEVVEQPAPAPVEAAPAPPPPPPPVVEEKPAPKAIAKPTSWASMARDNKSAQPTANHVPLRVSPVPEGVAEAAPVAPEVPSSRPPRAARQPAAEVLDKVMFGIAKVVSEEEIKTALGSLAPSVVSMRIVEHKKLVFIDFSVADALAQLRANPPTIGGAKINPYKQKPKE